MEFDEFKPILDKAVKAFEESWVKGMEDHPDQFPSECEYPDWMEQFVMFLWDYNADSEATSADTGV